MFLLKDTLSIKDETLFKACRSICLLARAITSEVPQLKHENFNLDHNFLINYCRDFSLILHICTRPQVDFPVLVSGLDLS